MFRESSEYLLHNNRLIMIVYKYTIHKDNIKVSKKNVIGVSTPFRMDCGYLIKLCRNEVLSGVSWISSMCINSIDKTQDEGIDIRMFRELSLYEARKICDFLIKGGGL